MKSWNKLSYLAFIHKYFCGSRGILKTHNQKFKTQEKPLWGEVWKVPNGLQISSRTEVWVILEICFRYLTCVLQLAQQYVCSLYKSNHHWTFLTHTKRSRIQDYGINKASKLGNPDICIFVLILYADEWALMMFHNLHMAKYKIRSYSSFWHQKYCSRKNPSDFQSHTTFSNQDKWWEIYVRSYTVTREFLSLDIYMGKAFKQLTI